MRQGKLLNTHSGAEHGKSTLSAAPLLVIQQFLGHSDPKTTLCYIRRAEELATRAYRYNTLPI